MIRLLVAISSYKNKIPGSQRPRRIPERTTSKFSKFSYRKFPFYCLKWKELPEAPCFQTLNISLKKEIAMVCVKPKKNCLWLDSKKTSNTKVRRSLISTSNKSLSLEDVRSEITKQFNKLKPASLCQPLEKVCVPGPPGKKGNKGSRGRRGGQGAKGKEGVQGIMG